MSENLKLTALFKFESDEATDKKPNRLGVRWLDYVYTLRLSYILSKSCKFHIHPDSTLYSYGHFDFGGLQANQFVVPQKEYLEMSWPRIPQMYFLIFNNFLYFLLLSSGTQGGNNRWCCNLAVLYVSAKFKKVTIQRWNSI